MGYLLPDSFSVRMNRSTSAMLPCLPTAPKRGVIPWPSHQALNVSHQNCWPLLLIMYFGAALALIMAVVRIYSPIAQFRWFEDVN